MSVCSWWFDSCWWLGRMILGHPVVFFLFLGLFAILTWYLLVELNGISATFLFLSLISLTDPQESSMHFRRADSEASPATSLFRIGRVSWPALNTALLHRAATRARHTHVTEVLSKDAPAEEKSAWKWIKKSFGKPASLLYLLKQFDYTKEYFVTFILISAYYS